MFRRMCVSLQTSSAFEATSRIAIAKFYDVAVAISDYRFATIRYEYHADCINAVARAILSLTFMLIMSQVAIEASSSET